MSNPSHISAKHRMLSSKLLAFLVIYFCVWPTVLLAYLDWTLTLTRVLTQRGMSWIFL